VRLNPLLALSLLVCVPICLPTGGAMAQERPATPASPTSPTLGAVEVTATPKATQEVIAEGRAAIGTGGVLAARKAAETIALRNAVEKAIGVFVSARTLTQNYVLIRDEVMTQASGFATLKEVLKEEIGTEEVVVTVRAIVSLRPLAEQLKALKLTRAWRFHVSVEGETPGQPAETVTTTSRQAVTKLERTLADAGFVVVADPKDADIQVQVYPRFATIAKREVHAGDIPMTLHSIRGDVTVRAVRAGTSEIVASASGSETILHINATTASAQAAEDAVGKIAPKIADALMILPAAQSQPITVAVSGLSGIGQATKMEEALSQLPGVRNVVRRSYNSGEAIWELDVYSEGIATLAQSLEETGSLRSFGLTVSSETKSRINATAKSAVDKPKPRQ